MIPSRETRKDIHMTMLLERGKTLDPEQIAINRQAVANFMSRMESGMSIGQFQTEFDNLDFTGLESEYRNTKRPLKILRDEITPLAKLLSSSPNPDDRVYKSTNPPDFMIVQKDGTRRAIECTTAGAYARQIKNRSLNATCASAGFIGVREDQPWKQFEAQSHKAEGMYTNEIIRDVVLANVSKSIKEKAWVKDGDILLIYALEVNIFERQRWINHSNDFEQAAKAAVNFNEVYLILDTRPDKIWLRIK